MLTMKKLTRLFFLIIILALIIHGLILLFLFGNKFMAIKKSVFKPEQTKTLKPVTIEPIPTQLNLPNMMPGQPTSPTSPPNPAEPTEPILEKPNTSDLPDKPKDSTNQPTQKKSSKRSYQPKPTFNFDHLNHYAIAEGNSIFKNQGENRPPTKEDLTILMYQERVRKHFSVSMNRYADQAYFYNINRAAIDLVIIIGKDGRVLDLRTRNHSNNPALHNLMEKIIKYAGLFPAIPEKAKLQSFTLMTTVTIAQGKLSSGYGWQ